MPDLRVVIADDEPLVRRELRRLLALEPHVRVVGEARDGVEALTQVAALHPDLLLLDVRMPELDGVSVARSLGDRGPAVVFVTAFDRYAVAAFDLHAVDYILKPFDESRVRAALERTRERLAAGRRPVDRDFLARLAPGSHLERFVVRLGARVELVAAKDVDWIEAADNYARLHCAGRRHLVRATLSRLEADLDPAMFGRIHRSVIVNVTRVKEMTVRPTGDWDVVLVDGTGLVLSRRFRAAFMARARRPDD